MNKFLTLAAAAGMMMAASAAAAQPVKVTNVSFNPGSVTGTIHSSVMNGDVGVGRFEFKGNYISDNTPFDILTYCIDLAHSVSLGNVNYTNYQIIPISAYAGMTTAKSNALNALLTNATPLLNAATGQDAINKSAAIQMAAWEIMFETQATWSVTNSTSAFYMSTPGGSSSQNVTALTNAETFANTYLTYIKNNTWTVNNAYDLKVLYSPTQQSQVFAVPAIPEPATWGMMVLGFGLVGGALRSRRRVATLATA